MSRVIPAHGLVLERSELDGAHTLTLKGELELVSSSALQDAVEELCAAHNIRRITIDMSALTFVDSTGMRAVLAASERCRARNCELALIPGPRNVQRPFELTGLAEVLPFQTDGAAEGP